MAKFKIVTTCDAITEYIVEAENADQARDKFYDGEFESERITDYQNEDILKVEAENE